MSTLALCIPAYNAAWCLPRLLQSAKDQEIQFDEIIVYNDCSTDETASVAKSYGATVISGTERNWNPIGKNKIAEHAKSEWLFYIDADDKLFSNFSIKAREWMNKENSPDIVLIPYACLDNFTDKFLYEIFYNRDNLKADTLKFTISEKIVNFELIKKEPFLRIGGFDTDPKILFVEDQAFAFKAALRGLIFDTELDIICIKYYLKTSMSTANLAKCFEAGYHLWAKVYDSVNGKYSKELCHRIFENAIWAGRENTWETVRNCLKLAKKVNPAILPQGSTIFILAFKLFPFHSFYLREMIIRKFAKKDV